MFVPDTGLDIKVAEALDALAERFGSGTVTRAALLEDAEDREEPTERR
jgi:hypothetical protein